MKAMIALAFGLMSIHLPQIVSADVYSNQSDETRFIKTILLDGGASIGFESCRIMNHRESCRIIGKSKYSVKQLRRARTHLRNCAIGVGVVDVLGVALTTGVSAIAVSTAVGIGSVSTTAPAVTGAVLGFGGGVAILKSLTPVKAIQLMKTLDEEIINDRTYITGISIGEFEMRLAETLENFVRASP